MSVLFAEPESAVAIVGGGPTGLMLAAELALGGVEVAVLEQRPHQELDGSRAGGLQTRTLELLDQRGIVERFLGDAETYQVVLFAEARLDTSDLPTRHPSTVMIWQNQVELILAEWIGELGVSVHYGQQVTGFTQDDAGVAIELADGSSQRAAYLVGCDGGRSGIRKAAGIEFPGWEATISALIAAVETTEPPEFGIRHGEHGINGIGPTGEGETVRMILTEREFSTVREPTLEELSAALVAEYGTDFGVHSPTWISRFTDTTRQAAAYREGRVLLAGDSAHIHYPAGGQGLQHGVHDAVNLGWKLAQVVKGVSPDALLDTYQAERHPPTAKALQWTMAAGALHRGDPRSAAVRTQITELAEMEEPRKYIAAERLGLATHYDFGAGHPQLGRRIPDLDLVTSDGPRRAYALLHAARPVLLNLGAPGALEVGAWTDQVEVVDASYEGEWELPVLGLVEAPTAVLIRPDGHVAWVGEGSDDGLVEALTRWFGSA